MSEWDQLWFTKTSTSVMITSSFTLSFVTPPLAFVLMTSDVINGVVSICFYNWNKISIPFLQDESIPNGMINQILCNLMNVKHHNIKNLLNTGLTCKKLHEKSLSPNVLVKVYIDQWI